MAGTLGDDRQSDNSWRAIREIARDLRSAYSPADETARSRCDVRLLLDVTARARAAVAQHDATPDRAVDSLLDAYERTLTGLKAELDRMQNTVRELGQDVRIVADGR